jgi:release factor glutamine methyltransferase
VLNLKRNELIFVNEVSEIQSKQIEKYAQERMKHIPIDKLFNKAYFYGLEFYVDEDVLTPRPESENLVELALSHIENEHYKSVLDLCCYLTSLGSRADH